MGAPGDVTLVTADTSAHASQSRGHFDSALAPLLVCVMYVGHHGERERPFMCRSVLRVIHASVALPLKRAPGGGMLSKTGVY